VVEKDVPARRNAHSRSPAWARRIGGGNTRKLLGVA
jgi:hypothetical protein